MTTTSENPVTARETTEDFTEKMMSAIDAASVAILVSIGHQTGLLDTLAELPPATSFQIADAADLDERYVREWLGGMVTGRVIDYDATTARTSCLGHGLPRPRQPGPSRPIHLAVR